MDLEITGLVQLNARLAAVAAALRAEAGNALRAEAEIEMTEAKRRTPVLTGALRASGNVTGPHEEGRDTVVKMTFGGAAAPYAIFVHENLAALHPVGQAKFLESVINESAPYLAARVAARMVATRLGA